MRVLLLLFVSLGLALPVVAQTIPDGRYIMGKQIWNSREVTPRYVELEIAEGVVSANYFSIFQPDASVCADRGHCEQRTTPVRFRIADVGDARVNAVEVERVEGEVTWDRPPEDNPDGQERFYVAPLLGRFENARVVQTSTGFELSNSNGLTPFFQAAPEDIQRVLAWTTTVQESMFDMDGCEVRGLMPILQNADASPEHRILADGLHGVALLNAIGWEADRLINFKDGYDNEAVSKISGRAMPARMALLVARFEPDLDLTDQSALVDALTKGFADKSPELRRELTANLEPFLPYLTAMAQLGKSVHEYQGQMTGNRREAFCADPSFGLIPN